jgi:hypothetical protein
LDDVTLGELPLLPGTEAQSVVGDAVDAGSVVHRAVSHR